ncbi:gastrula zinc finger protein XlCGF67.1-like [Synchiropus splendidus]|uniref:gastrula zinc finger protein XlCGF67.1-like n=1 Tax=Synchiropus splendidus TaxID=270530 RepID=UPI00237DDB8C|nr:gastrula zinc finger protein XlCGF67.1-like [Synchiropus splendidus]
MEVHCKVMDVVRRATVQSDDRAQLLGQEEAGPTYIKEEEAEGAVTKFPFPVGMDSEDDNEVRGEEPPTSSSNTRNNCGGPESTTYLNPLLLFDHQGPLSPELKTEISDCLNEAQPVSNLEINETRDEIESLSCLFCGKRFGQRRNLEVHTRIHTGEKLFDCMECGKCFNRSDHLKTHMKIHTGEKTFRCSECGKCFYQCGGLTTHMRIHTGEKPFSCSACAKRFNRIDHLKRHMKIHTGERPFCCSECGKCFTEKGDMKKHMRRRH